MDEIIKHDEEQQVPAKVSLDSLPSVRQSNVEISDFEECLRQCLYHMRDCILSTRELKGELVTLNCADF